MDKMIHVDIKKELKSEKNVFSLDLNISFSQGKFITLYGKSGAGKTSTLRMLAGLMVPDRGKIEVFGETWFDHSRKINQKPQKRRSGYVFQDFALFPNMTVNQNLKFAAGKHADIHHIASLIDLMEIADIRDRYPTTLSGGQKQRVALARTLAVKPKVLLLDEPLSSLDVDMRSKLQDYILKVHHEYKLSTLMVSHDMGEVAKLSDLVYVIEKGKIIRFGKPIEVFKQDRISGKFQFIGEILDLKKEDIVYVVTISIGNNIVRIVAENAEAELLNVGDKVMVASKAFNPLIRKIES